MVWLGLRSYSIYLWHWPLLALATYRLGEGLTPELRMVLVVLAIALADVTYRVIEQPARHGFSRVSPAISVAGAIGVVALVSVVSVGIVQTDGLPERLPQRVAEFQRTMDAEAPPSACLDGHPGVAKLDCAIGDPSAARKSFLVWGDSHALALSPAISKLAATRGLQGVVAIRMSCAPVFVTSKTEGPFARGKCIDMAMRVEEALEAQKFDEVILIGRWAIYAEGTETQAGETVHNRFYEGSASENHRRFVDLLSRTIARIRQTGSRVTLIGPVPELRDNLPNAMARMMLTGAPANLDVPQSRFEERNSFVMKTLYALDAKPDVRVVYLHPHLCNGRSCATQSGGRPLYVDDNHLSATGANTVLPSLEAALNFSTGTR
jgi:hypothetical protein